MTFETEYHADKAWVAVDLFAAMNALANTPYGQRLIIKSNLNGLVVRGSAGGLLPGQSPIFFRNINDIDLRVYTRDVRYQNEHMLPMLRFIGLASKSVGLKITFTARAHQSSYIAHRLLRHFFPRVDAEITQSGDRHIITGMHVSLTNAPPPPLTSQDAFIKAEHPLLRLAEKIRALHNTHRVVGITSGEDDQKIRRALDLLDTYQVYHLALAETGSHQGVLDGLGNIYGTSTLSHFNRRTTISIIQQNLQNGFLYADLKHFDEQTNMHLFLPRFIKRMQRAGIIQIFQPLSSSVVMATAYDLMDHMPLPVSKALLTLRRPVNALRNMRRKPEPK